MGGFTTAYLTPIKEKPKLEPFGVIDLEGRKWIQLVCAGVYDGSEFCYFKTLDELFNFLLGSKISTWFSHFGGIYDFLFFLRHAILSEGEWHLHSLIPRGSGIMCFDLLHVKTGKKITFRDSGAILPMGLDKLTKSFGVVHKKGKINFSKIRDITPDLIAYLKNDCVGLYEVLERYFANPLIERAGPKYTVASQSLQIFRSFIREKIPGCPQGIDPFIRRGYAGGRVEIFRPFFKSKSARRTLNCYDVTSLYPSVMRDFDVPGEFEELLDNSVEAQLDRMGFVECTVEVPKGTYLPLLWSKTADGKFIFPTGVFRGVYTTLELRRACQDGAKIIQTHGAAYFSPLGGVFKDFVETLAEQRENTTDEALRTQIKLTLNSLYGRCGMNLEREGLVWDEGQAGVKPYMEIPLKNGRAMRFATETTTLRSWNHVGIAAWITAAARLRMYEYMKAGQDDLYYTDTDSLYTTKKYPISKKIGELKKENKKPITDACFLLPKTYYTTEKIVMKGFSSRKIKHFKLVDFETALEGDLRALRVSVPAKMARLKTALRHGEFLYMQKKGEKRIKSKYDKRIVFRRGKRWDSRPIHLNENKKGQ